MKKLFLILAIMMISVSSFSQSFSLTSTHFNYHVTGSNWGEWIPATVPAIVNMDSKQVYIYSQTPQTITFNELYQEDFNGYSNFKGYALDGNGTTVGLNITIYESGVVFICISYSDGEYMYKFLFNQNSGQGYM